MEYKHLQEVLERYGEYFREKAKQNLLEDGSNASGTLTNSIEYIFDNDGKELSVSISLEDYWKWVNDGTSPHFPPVNKLIEWIKVKPVIPTAMGNGKVPTVEQLAFLIGRKISIEGTKGTNFFDRAFDDTNERFLLAIEKAIEEDIDEEVDSMLLHLML